MAKETYIAREGGVNPINAIKSNAEIVKQRNKLQMELLNRYNRSDSSAYTLRRYAQVNNAATNLLRQNGVTLSETNGYMVTDTRRRRNVSVREYPGLNVSR